jgi:dihydroflavonol-4-reductase
VKALLTGADGFLGSNLSRELLKRGIELRGTTQPGRDSWTLDGLAIERVETDILNLESVKAAMKGVDVVIHAAAATAIWPPRSEIVRRVNVDGTRNILDAAREIGIKKLVHVGTANSFAAGPMDRPGDETGPYDAGQFELDYMDSKYEAHNMVKAAADAGDVPALEVNPTFMWGPFDRAPGPGKMILRVCRQEVPGAARGGRNCVSVQDVSVAIANALTRGRVGESYILGNVNLDYETIFTTIARVVGAEIHPRVYPDWFVMLAGTSMSVVGALRRTEPVVSRAMAKISCGDHYYTAEKAVRELGLPQSPIEEAISVAYEWFLANGYVYDEKGRIPKRMPTLGNA